MLSAQIIKEKALEYGADLVGIGDIRHFEGTPPQRDPRSILPDATCVIGFGFRVPRALYRTMDSGRQFYNYTQLGVKYIDEEFAEIFLLKMGGLIEDEGYDACLQRKESGRGMYVLTDYPEKDPALAKGLVVSKGEEGPSYSWLEPAAR